MESPDVEKAWMPRPKGRREAVYGRVGSHAAQVGGRARKDHTDRQSPNGTPRGDTDAPLGPLALPTSPAGPNLAGRHGDDS